VKKNSLYYLSLVYCGRLETLIFCPEFFRVTKRGAQTAIFLSACESERKVRRKKAGAENQRFKPTAV